MTAYFILQDLDERLYIVRLRIFENIHEIETVHVSYDARCAAMYFAKLADVFLAVEKHNEKVLNEPQNEL